MHQCPDTIQLRLYDPARFVLDLLGLFRFEISPVPQEHWMDLKRDGLTRVHLLPVVISQGKDVWFCLPVLGPLLLRVHAWYIPS